MEEIFVSVEESLRLANENNEEVSNDILKYIEENLKGNFKTKLEQVIAIYLLLCRLFEYDIKLAAHQYFTSPLSCFSIKDVSINNNQINCNQFAIIYKKILSKYKIKSEVIGDNQHQWLLLSVNGKCYELDPFNYGKINETDEYLLDDVSRVKFGIKIGGITCDIPLDENIHELEKEINYVYEVMNTNKRKIIIEEEFYSSVVEPIKKYLSKTFKEKNKRDIERRIRIINYFLSLNVPDARISKLHFFKKYWKELFSEYSKDEIKDITLYDKNNNDLFSFIIVRLDSLYVFLEENNDKRRFNSLPLNDFLTLLNNSNLKFIKEIDQTYFVQLITNHSSTISLEEKKNK